VSKQVSVNDLKIFAIDWMARQETDYTRRQRTRLALIILMKMMQRIADSVVAEGYTLTSLLFLERAANEEILKEKYQARIDYLMTMRVPLYYFESDQWVFNP
jgi:hypothetical protein